MKPGILHYPAALILALVLPSSVPTTLLAFYGGIPTALLAIGLLLEGVSRLGKTQGGKCGIL